MTSRGLTELASIEFVGPLADPQQYVWNQRQSGRGWRALETSLMTHRVDWLRDFGATQHGQRAAIPTYKCSVSYSITSSAATSSLSGTVKPSAFAVLRLRNSSTFVAC